MSSTRPRLGVRHPTVVPGNFNSDPDTEPDDEHSDGEARAESRSE